jgi:hypothetical protein
MYIRDSMMDYARTVAGAAGDPSRPLERLLGYHIPEKGLIKLRQVKKAMEAFWPVQDAQFGIRGKMEGDRFSRKRKLRFSVEVLGTEEERRDDAEAGEG